MSVSQINQRWRNLELYCIGIALGPVPGRQSQYLRFHSDFQRKGPGLTQ